MGRKVLASTALFIPDCSSIHTCFMLAPIDVVWVDGSGRVVGVNESVGPWRFLSGPRESISVLELPAGFTVQHSVQVGDIIECQQE